MPKGYILIGDTEEKNSSVYIFYIDENPYKK